MNKDSKQLRRIGVVALVLGVSACTARTDDAAVAVDTGMSPAAPESPVIAPPVAPAAGGTWINPNSATTAQLMAIPGMTQALADAVVAGRPYTTMTGVNTVLAGTLSEQQRDSVYTRLWKPIDLNKATGAEIQLIPGVGARMEHEFEEYRPYTNIARFRREMGKYVDAAEVARLEKYVEIR
ncbi:MAG: hypothetical protein ABIR58_05510 [Gemmatimonadaceae bacterium]